MNVTVCLSQSTTANFTCVVDAGMTGITSAGWRILVEGFYVTVVGRARHMLDPRTSLTNFGTILTETLTVTDVSVSDNGAKYRCRPVDNVISDVVTLIVIYRYVCIMQAYVTLKFTFMCVSLCMQFKHVQHSQILYLPLHNIPYTVC